MHRDSYQYYHERTAETRLEQNDELTCYMQHPHHLYPLYQGGDWYMWNESVGHGITMRYDAINVWNSMMKNFEGNFVIFSKLKIINEG